MSTGNDTKDRYAAGVADATKDIADWLRSGTAAALFGSETWALRRALAKRIADDTWRTTKDDDVLLRVERNASSPIGTDDDAVEARG